MSRAGKFRGLFSKYSFFRLGSVLSRTNFYIIGDPELLSKLMNHLHSQYPLDASSFFGSLPHRVLHTFYTFFEGIFPPRELDSQVFGDHVAAASQITQVLRALSPAKWDGNPTDHLTHHGSAGKKGKKSKKHMAPETGSPIPVDAVDTEAFRALGLVVPSSIEVTQTASDLLGVHKRILTAHRGSFSASQPDIKKCLS